MTRAERAVLKAALRRYRAQDDRTPGHLTRLSAANRLLRDACGDLLAERKRGRRREEVTLVDVLQALEEA